MQSISPAEIAPDVVGFNTRHYIVKIDKQIDNRYLPNACIMRDGNHAIHPWPPHAHARRTQDTKVRGCQVGAERVPVTRAPRRYSEA